MIDFPNSPALNQVFSPSTGLSYKWDGAKWVWNAAGIPPGTAVWG